MVSSFLRFACHLSCGLEPHMPFSIYWGNFTHSKQDWMINFRGLQIEVSPILIIRILIISCLWALFGSRFQIIFRISSVEIFFVDRALCFFVRVTWISLLLLTIEHWLAEKLLKIFVFSLKSVINLSWCSSGGM